MKTSKKLILAASGSILLGFGLAQSASADSYTIQNGDSFFSIADSYGVDPYQLAADNGMTIWSTILPGQTITVSGAQTTVEQQTEASAEVTEAASATEDTADSSENLYPIGQCTWGVKEMATWASNWWGNGGDWASSASSQGYTVGTTPVAGSIVCWTDGGYGHVAYVTAVAEDGKIQVMEANYKDQQAINNYRGWFDPQNSVTPGTVTYIYPY
ncbi:CHAP domain-containing protein [Streptococcus dentiloxodontae]